MNGRKTGFREEGKAIQVGKHLPERLLDATAHFAVTLKILHKNE